jgi:hypothetical protein
VLPSTRGVQARTTTGCNAWPRLTSMVGPDARWCTTCGGARASRLAEQVEPARAVIWGARRGRWQAGLDRRGDHRPPRSTLQLVASNGVLAKGRLSEPGEPVCAGGRDRDRTCDFCRVKGARAPHIPMRHSALHHNVAAQWLWRTEATQCCVWRSEASFLANLWQGRVINQRGGWLAGPTAA